MNIVTSTWTDIIQQFFPIFTAPGAEIFSSLITGWILCTARRTITGILPFADPSSQHAHDAYHRFFPDSRWDINRLWQILTLVLVKIFYPSFLIILSDYFNLKRFWSFSSKYIVKFCPKQRKIFNLFNDQWLRLPAAGSARDQYELEGILPTISVGYDEFQEDVDNVWSWYELAQLPQAVLFEIGFQF